MCLIVWLSAANSKIVIASKCFVGFWITHTVSFVVVLLRVFYYFCYSRQTAPAADSKNSCRRRWRRDEDRWRFLFYDRGWYKWVYCTAEEKEEKCSVWSDVDVLIPPLSIHLWAPPHFCIPSSLCRGHRPSWDTSCCCRTRTILAAERPSFGRQFSALYAEDLTNRSHGEKSNLHHTWIDASFCFSSRHKTFQFVVQIANNWAHSSLCYPLNIFTWSPLLSCW